VSTPLDWKEVNNKLNPLNFDITNIIDRIEKKRDLFNKVMDEKVAHGNSKILHQLL
jgi:bifunctional non-homologous end joining protein LigD